MKPMFVNGKCPRKKDLHEKPWNLAFARPGKKHFNVCKNPE